MSRVWQGWSNIPQTAGTIYWVAPSASYTVEGKTYIASDANDGKSPKRAVLTLDYAVGLCTANAGDVIVLLPGAHSWTASVAADVAGITIMGLPAGLGNPWRQKTSITTSATDEVINVTAANIEIAFLHVIVVTTKAGIDWTAAADQLYIHDCSFDMVTATANTGTIGVGATTSSISADNVVLRRNYFLCDAAQGPAIAMGDSYNYLVEDCHMRVYDAVTWAAAATCVGVTSQMGVWKGNSIVAAWGATITAGIVGADVTSVNTVHFIDNRFSGLFASEKWIEDFGAGEARISENYAASIGGGSGGVLVTTIT